ncbi:hypothetical protein BHE74_00025286 [Ensete ventricosum]|nr:hypothetical protein BHE74_00025286 [Ensete ventricosum]
MEEKKRKELRTRRVMIISPGQGLKAPLDGNHELRRHGHPRHQVLIDQCLVLQLLPLRHRERRLAPHPHPRRRRRRRAAVHPPSTPEEPKARRRQ